MQQKLLEVIGAITGLAGTALLALGMCSPFYTFVIYAASNVSWILYARCVKAQWLLLMNVGYMTTTIVGLVHYWPS